MTDRIKNMGDRRQVGVTDANRKGAFVKGQSGNPGGKVSLANDLKRAQMIGVPPEVTRALDEWFENAGDKLADLGADGFIAGLRAALDEATQRVLPVDPAHARAMWWRMILPIAFAGPQGQKDSNWSYASQEVGVRLLGKPKETIAVESSDAPRIDWSQVPEDEREDILRAIQRLQAYMGEPASDAEH